ncbi:MAG: phosphoribosyltransferase [Pseudomonadota bacterium]
MRPEAFWQDFVTDAPPPPWQGAYPATMPDGRVLLLPIRPLEEGQTALASLILNQAGFEVERAVADLLAARLRPLKPDIVVGLPTLGLTLARAVAERLGHSRYVPLGTSQKFWYDPALSVPLRSITSPDSEKRLYLDPRLRPLLPGRRIALIDDVISTGRSISAGLDLLSLAGVTPIVIGTAMLQTDRSTALLEQRGFASVHVFKSPLLTWGGTGWV